MTVREKRNFRRHPKLKDLQVPEFSTYEAEVDFWDNLDTADLMEDNGQWFRFETPPQAGDPSCNSSRGC